MVNYLQFIKELDAVCGKFGVSVYLDTTEGEVSISSENPKSLHRILFFPNVDNWPEANEPYVQPDVSEQVQKIMGMCYTYAVHHEIARRMGSPDRQEELREADKAMRAQLTELLRGVK